MFNRSKHTHSAEERIQEVTERLTTLENRQNSTQKDNMQSEHSIQVQIPKELLAHGYTIMLQREQPMKVTQPEPKTENQTAAQPQENKQQVDISQASAQQNEIPKIVTPQAASQPVVHSELFYIN